MELLQENKDLESQLEVEKEESKENKNIKGLLENKLNMIAQGGGGSKEDAGLASLIKSSLTNVK